MGEEELVSGISRRAFLASLAAVGGLTLAGCAASNGGDSQGAVTEEETADNGALDYEKVDVESATEDEVREFLDDTSGSKLLVDARPQEAYAGWAIEGAANGGHLRGAKLFSSRWLDCEYDRAGKRENYLTRAMDDQGISSDTSVIVYDYNGNQALNAAQYLKSKGVDDIRIFQADKLIDAGDELESYENYRYFIPAEIVKSISDVKCGKAATLSDAAKEIVGDDIDKAILIDVSWGNNKESTYFTQGHIPGSIHINTDAYERPRVYVPEKRSDYAKEWRKIPIEEFASTVAPRYGITTDSVCILSSNATAPHARLGFYLRNCGVRTYVVSGGLIGWKYAGYDLDTDPDTLVIPTPVESMGNPQINNTEVSDEAAAAILAGEMDGQIVDNRGEKEWNGEYSGYSYHDLSGRPDGSIWCCQGTDEDGEFFQNADLTPRTQEEYLSYLRSNGVDPDRLMAFFCGDSWGATMIAYWCQSTDLSNVNVWTHGWIYWSNEGHEFVDHNGNKVHYDRNLDTVIDERGNDMRDGVNFLDDVPAEE